MKNYITLLTLSTVLLLIACKQKPASNASETENANMPTMSEVSDGSYCYLKTEGRDTTSIQLNINENDVTGEMNWRPYEKDGGYGTLQGTRTGDEIKAIWSYMIEGSNQTEEVYFKMHGDHLMRKVGELEDPNFDGNLKLKDPDAATYSEMYMKVDCK